MSTNEIKTNGITLFSLTSDFKEDVTKNCGLLGKEIDANFLFLRNNDIYGGEIKDDTLILHRGGDLDDIIIPGIDSSIELLDGYIDEIKGALIIETNKGAIEITGFTKGDTINTIHPLKGSGTLNDPVRVSESFISPFLPSVKTYVDLTNGDVINDEYKIKGYCILTKEVINDYGLLYNFNGVKEIASKLTESSSQWRVPSNEDWFEMLNAIEICDDRNHGTELNGDYGRFAGAYLKSDVDNWSNIIPTSFSYGFKAYPVGVKYSKNGSILDFGKLTKFWSNTINKINEVWIRELTHDKTTVKLGSIDENNGFFSIRLVRDYNTSNENDVILGDTYDIVKMPYVKTNEENKIIERGYRLWTSTNIKSIVSDNNYSTTSFEDVKTCYFINFWNGVYWDKRQVAENDIFIIEDRNNRAYMLSNDEIIIAENSFVNLNGYATEEWVNKQNYLTEHQDISHLASKDELQESFEKAIDIHVASFSVNDIILRSTKKTVSTYITRDFLNAVESNKVIILPYHNNNAMHNGVVVSAYVVKYSNGVELYLNLHHKTSIYNFNIFILNDKNEVSLNDVNPSVINVQPELVSGENIKQINGESIVGEGNLDVSNLYITEFTLENLDSGTVMFTNELWDAANSHKVIMVNHNYYRQGGYIANVITRTLTTDKVELYFHLFNPNTNTKYYFKSSFTYSTNAVQSVSVEKTIYSTTDYVDEKFDTIMNSSGVSDTIESFIELQEWIETHGSEVNDITNAITNNTNEINAIEESLENYVKKSDNISCGTF